ncbi:hypothetical protein A4S05_23505 [Nostoc sp. KVJ20]|uniref:hypothetical protein n=1 Tax=Nostoc sp. KVJ20 TaxID=457944 RepID=UPI00083DBF64|nr:hypothetical protein [Nostoc sp. KVJ20]ODH02580.1 hypothetical protein A4S05_23505 [Nostoc sp. KVJ20]
MNKSINLFSKTGITILLVLTLPIFTVVILGSYFPKTWQSIVLQMGWARFDNSPSRTTSTTRPNTNRTFLGRSKTGYELWADGSCVYVKGLTESDLTRLNTTIDTFKQAVKEETGYKCVYLE